MKAGKMIKVFQKVSSYEGWEDDHNLQKFVSYEGWEDDQNLPKGWRF